METLKKLNKIFSKKTKFKLLILLVAIIIGGFLEMLVLSLLSPFISVLLDSSIVYENPYISWVYNLLGFTNINSFLALLAFILAFIYIFRGVYFLVLSRVKIYFVARRQAELSQILLSKTLGFSYLYHTGKNVAELMRIIGGDVVTMFSMINSILLMLSDYFMMLFILVFLLILSPIMTLCVLGLSLACVLIYFKAFKGKIRSTGEINRTAGIRKSKSVLQALGGIKDIKVLRRENHFKKVFKKCNDLFIKTSTQYQFINAIPKFSIEIVCFGGAFILLGFFILGGANITDIVPQLSLFVLAAFRLLPAVSRQVSYLNTIIHNRPSVDAVYHSLFEENDISATLPPEESIDANDTSRDIVIRNLSFRYPRITEPVLENLSFSIPAMKSVAFIGPSGVGKTTLVDIILGLLNPDTGGVFYEGKSIHHNLNEWGKNIGYIPQQIYLLDESIMENVAFGIDSDKIDEKKVWRALEQAQLKDFVKSLPEGVNTFIGDRGVRLSGGQRQRVGIARAMYENPSILVLDEATSSLDNETERAVMDAVMGFHGNKTLIIVAHRLSTIEHCDIVYKVENQTVTRER
jgi:ABC-type multidrug transport system fused ATPase/permease subunit